MRYISVLEYLMDRAKPEELTPEQMSNMNTLIPRVNDLLELLEAEGRVRSGYRTTEANEKAGGKPKSKHLVCAAVDLEDTSGELKRQITPHLLEICNLYMEHPSATPTWVHLQCIAPKSGNRIFKP